MSDYGVLANFEAIEGTSTGSEQTLTFIRKSRQVVITNDHATNDLTYKFNASETAGTLGPTETLSIYFTGKRIIINGTSVPYRIWVFG